MTETATVHEIQWGDRMEAPDLTDPWSGRSRRARSLEKMPQDVADSFTEAQLAAIERALEERPTSKPRVDLRLSIPLFQRRRFLVLLAGSEGRSPERRRQDRSIHRLWTLANVTQRGYYLGSNVSYNGKKMVENGYLIQKRSPHDRRSFHVRASDKGLEIYQRLDELFAGHSERLDAMQFMSENLEQANTTLRRLEQFWATPQHFTNQETSVA